MNTFIKLVAVNAITNIKYQETLCESRPLKNCSTNRFWGPNDTKYRIWLSLKQ